MIAEKVQDTAMVELEASKVTLDELLKECEKRLFAYTRPQPMRAYVWCFNQERAHTFASLINNNELGPDIGEEVQNMRVSTYQEKQKD